MRLAVLGIAIVVTMGVFVYAGCFSPESRAAAQKTVPDPMAQMAEHYANGYRARTAYVLHP
jgi:hypothetical protein